MTKLRFRLAAVAAICLVATPALAAHGNPWEDAYLAVRNAPAPMPSAVEAERIKGSGDLDTDIRDMWRKGFAPIGISAFAAMTGNTRDAARLAAKLKARYYIAVSHLTATYENQVAARGSGIRATDWNIPLMGSGGWAPTVSDYSSGQFVPQSVGRYDNFAIFFAEMPRTGTGILVRDDHGSLRVRAVRDGSPAARAGIVAEDRVAAINGSPATEALWLAANGSGAAVTVEIVHNTETRRLTLSPGA